MLALIARVVSTCKLVNHKDRIDYCALFKFSYVSVVFWQCCVCRFDVQSSIGSYNWGWVGSNCVDQALRFAFNG